MVAQNTASTDWVVVGLKIAPLIFSLILEVLPLGFGKEWTSTANEYFGSKGIEWDREDIEWRYKHLTVFIFDQLKARYTLTLSLVYASLIFALAYLQIEKIALLVLFLWLLLYTPVWWFTVDRWYRIDPEENRDPDRYYNDYYNKTGDRVYEPFYEFLPPRISREIEPRRVAVSSEGLLIVAILALNIFPSSIGTYIVGGLVFTITILGFLLYL